MAVEAVRQQVATAATVQAVQAGRHRAAQPTAQVATAVLALVAIPLPAVRDQTAVQVAQRAAFKAGHRAALQVQPPAVVVADRNLTKTSTIRLSRGLQAVEAGAAVTQPVRLSHRLAQAPALFYRIRSVLLALTQAVAVLGQLVV